MHIMQIRYVRLKGGYVVECRFDEYYEDPTDEWPTGYAWFYDVKNDDDEVLAIDGPYKRLYYALNDAFSSLIDLEYERTGLQYTVEMYDYGSKYMVIVRDFRDGASREGDYVVHAEHICDYIYHADLESDEAVAYLAEVHRLAFNKYYSYWLEQEKSRENAAT